MQNASRKCLREDVPCETHPHAYINFDFVYKQPENVN
jgi:hypothetical protein